MVDEKEPVGRERENSWREQVGERMVIRLSGGCISLFPNGARASLVCLAGSRWRIKLCRRSVWPIQALQHGLFVHKPTNRINALPLSFFIVSCRRGRFVAGMRPCTDWPVWCGTVRYSIVQPVRYRIYILSRKRKPLCVPSPAPQTKNCCSSLPDRRG